MYVHKCHVRWGRSIFDPNNRLCALHFHLFFHVCLRSFVPCLLFKFQKIWTGQRQRYTIGGLHPNSTESLFLLTFDFWPLSGIWALHHITWGHFSDQFTLKSFKMWASLSIRGAQQALINHFYRDGVVLLLICWRCCGSSLGLILWQHMVKNAGNLLFQPMKCSKIKSLGTFSKHFANISLVCCYMVLVLYSALPC